MGKLTVTFHPAFIIFSFIIVLFGWVHQFVIYMIVLILHELAHYLTAKKLGYKLNKILFMPYGVGLSGSNNIFKPSHEIIIALAGPMFNIILSVITIALWWVFPITYYYTDLFVLANISLGVFNLLPVFPLDGGRVFVAFTGTKISKIKALKVMNITAIIFSVFFGASFILSVFYKINLTFIFIAMFLFTSAFGNYKNIYYERSFESLLKDSCTKPIEVKTYLISNKTPIHKLVKYINGNQFVQFMIMNEDHKIVKVVTETELKKLLSNHNLKIDKQ